MFIAFLISSLNLNRLVNVECCPWWPDWFLLLLFSIKFLICCKTILSIILDSNRNTNIGLWSEICLYFNFRMGQILAISHWLGNVWVLMQLFIIYAKGDAQLMQYILLFLLVTTWYYHLRNSNVFNTNRRLFREDNTIFFDSHWMKYWSCYLRHLILLAFYFTKKNGFCLFSRY